ncbi:MAG: bifunctional glutamate N-acetyltransferase/amino-acid acetyltransferase ArgJ [Gammaproteobacteria bacterium]|nr:bifunctional glutamate N-acetyltransferase/amino-acid acetyltransferase ArgJ [Gammaproteobacteria bacterium]
MPVRLAEPDTLLPVPGIRLGVARAGIRYPDRDDLVVMEVSEGCRCAAVFTTNAFSAAPVNLARLHLSEAAPRYLLINSGNANAGTGDRGLADAVACCRATAEHTACDVRNVLPFSTGVIGEPLPVQNIREAIPRALEQLQQSGWLQAARAIMTTDTVAKGSSRRFHVDREVITVTGIAKGAGMIRPDMATMLAFVATDARVQPDLLQASLQQTVNKSFNRITVDGDTSTNDACVLLATGASGVTEIDSPTHPAYAAFTEALDAVCRELAQAIVRDGEGAHRFVTVRVENGASEDECLAVAYAVAHSPLVKTALFAGDPNWGRILAAVGRAGVDGLDIAHVGIQLDDVSIVEHGARAHGYTEEQGQAVMKQDEITLRIQLGRGEQHATVWTTDLSYDYVRINAEYRT